MLAPANSRFLVAFAPRNDNCLDSTSPQTNMAAKSRRMVQEILGGQSEYHTTRSSAEEPTRSLPDSCSLANYVDNPGPRGSNG